MSAELRKPGHQTLVRAVGCLSSVIFFEMET